MHISSASAEDQLYVSYQPDPGVCEHTPVHTTVRHYLIRKFFSLIIHSFWPEVNLLIIIIITSVLTVSHLLRSCLSLTPVLYYQVSFLKKN